jgi:hypothetical protein
MGHIRKDHDGVHLDYSVTEGQDFDQAVFGLLQLVQQAQRDHPDEPRHLHLAIERHRLPNGDFDLDALELQSKFLMEFLMEYLAGATPAHLTAEQVAWVLNCQAHDVPVLVAARLLKPLGNPPPNSVKFFAASELLEQVKDRTWLAKVTNALNQHWQKRNAAKQNRPANVFAGQTSAVGN